MSLEELLKKLYEDDENDKLYPIYLSLKYVIETLNGNLACDADNAMHEAFGLFTCLCAFGYISDLEQDSLRREVAELYYHIIDPDEEEGMIYLLSREEQE